MIQEKNSQILRGEEFQCWIAFTSQIGFELCTPTASVIVP
jgi:hypothetical protein